MKAVRMTEGPLVRNIIAFAIPIALSGMIQQLFNAADTAVVGRFADANALAAVGINGELIAFFICLSGGLAIGSNVLIANAIGRKNESGISLAVHSSLCLALLAGVLGMIAGLLVADPLLRLIDTPSSIFHLASVYLKLYFLGYPFLLIYDFGSAILRSHGDSRSPFLILLAAGVVNVVLNLVFVILFHMDVAGVAIATDIATALSAVFVVYRLAGEEGPFRFRMGRLTLHGPSVSRILTIGITAALQGAVFCLANIFVQAAVNTFGTTVVAGNTIALNYEYFTYYLITAFGQTATTFVSQNWGAGNLKRCLETAKDCLLLSLIGGFTINIPASLFYPLSAGLFSPDPAIIKAASVRFLIIVILEPLCSFIEVPAGFLRGLGHSTLPALWTILGTCVLRIFWILTVFAQFHDIRVLYVVFPISWVLMGLLMLGSCWRVLRRSA